MSSPYRIPAIVIRPEVPWHYSPGLLDCEITEAISNCLRWYAAPYLP